MTADDHVPDRRPSDGPPAAPDARALGAQVVELIAEHLAGIADRPVFRPVPAELAKRFQTQVMPSAGIAAENVLQEFTETVLPYPLGNGHPRFWGWVNSPPQLLGVYAEALAAAMNPSVAGGNHAAVHVERQLIRWFCELAGLPDTSFGLLTSGGSMATLTALTAARHRAARRAGIDVRAQGMNTPGTRFVLYLGSEGHSCARKAAELLGIGSDNVRTIPSDEQHRMRADLLDAQLIRDLAAGIIPIAVMATAGTVNTGAVDPLDAIARSCAEHDIWLHVDGAYGAPAILLLDEFTDTRAALARADSIALDPHKWLYVPVDAGLVLLRDGDTARDAFSLVPSYLRTDGNESGSAGPPWFSEYGFEQTRPFRALKIWMLLKHIGLDGYRALIARDISLADALARGVDAAPELQLLARGLSVCCFRAAPAQVPADHLDELNTTLTSRIQLAGHAFVSATTVDGVTALRACIVNPGSTADDVNSVIARIRDELAQLLSECLTVRKP
jgi:aromatic-L-amino-acid/L-tryptophan decarboxylase